MSLTTFKNRWPENAAGKYYVDDRCLDCDYCSALAPDHFRRNDERGYFYVSKQAATAAEEATLQDAMEACPCEAIDDGDQYDAEAPSEGHRLSVEERIALIENKPCPHCRSSKRRWWEFWK